MPLSTALADTGGGGADLGLDAVAISGGTIVAKTAVVTLHGTISCSQDLTAFVWADVSQVVGRFNTIRGTGGQEVACSAASGTAAFDMTVFAEAGKFAPGNVRVGAYADTGYCDAIDCYDDFASFGPAAVRLSRR
ncbi:MAG: hypothetical protein ABJC39_12680 [Chloroflexota bacterium]